MKSDSKESNGFEEAAYRFYSAGDALISPEDEASTFAILNSLKHQSTRYDTPALMAEGGEKRIFKVYDRHLNRFVAMAQAAHATEDRHQEQFLREGQLTANLTHPNIVPIHNMGLDPDGVPFFTMELVPGDSLGDIIGKLKRGEGDYPAQYGLKTLLDIFNKVCDAVAYAHSRSVLHLDIKPDNIRVGQFGEVFLCDWGLARVERHIDDRDAEYGELDADLLNDMTLSGTIKGTPGFMAPEQITNAPKTEQTDIYALGAILYLILTHHLPVDGETANEIVENTRRGNVIPPRRRKSPGRIPRSLAAMAMQALAFKPENRYANVQAMQADLNLHLAGFPTEAEHADLFTRMGRLAQRHRKLTAWLLAFFILLAVVMSVNLSIIDHEKKLAEENLALAEKNFALYRKQQEEANRINKRLSDLSFSTKYVLSYVSARSMISIAEQLLEQGGLDPARKKDIQVHKARMHMVLQEFNAAVQAFGQLEELDLHSPAMLELCQEYGTLKPDDETALSDHDLARFLTTHYNVLPRPMAMYVYYHYRKRNLPVDPETHIEVVGAMLDRLNSINSRSIPELKLSRRPQGWHLDMSHTPYSLYTVDIPLVYGQNVLQPLNLHSLDISRAPIALNRELWELQIKELRMVGTHLKPEAGLAGLLKHMGVERVILGKADYPDKEIGYIRALGIEVVEEEYE